MSSGLPDRLPAEEIERALDELLRDSKWGDGSGEEEAGFLVEWITDFFEWLGRLFSAEDVAAGAEIGSKIFLAIVILLGVIVLTGFLTTIAGRWQRSESIPTLDGGALARRVEELRRDARAAQRDGEWTRALRLYFFATVVGLGERGDLEYHDAWTNRELLERGEPEREARDILVPLVGELDEHSFGKRPTSAEEVDRFSRVCDRLLGGGA